MRELDKLIEGLHGRRPEVCGDVSEWLVAEVELHLREFTVANRDPRPDQVRDLLMGALRFAADQINCGDPEILYQALSDVIEAMERKRS